MRRVLDEAERNRDIYDPPGNRGRAATPPARRRRFDFDARHDPADAPTERNARNPRGPQR